MFQQILAITIILFVISRISWQKKRQNISGAEFWFWTIFWLLALVGVLLLKKIDQAVAILGFSAQGIDILLYATVILLLYFIFRIRLRLEKVEKSITILTREIAMDITSQDRTKNLGKIDNPRSFGAFKNHRRNRYYDEDF